MRLDIFLSEKYNTHTRSQITNAIKSGAVKVNGEVITKCGYEVSDTDKIEFTPPAKTTTTAIPQDIPLNVIYEDAFLMIINKPRGMVTHPGAGNHENTLLNALLHHTSSKAEIPDLDRAGIVHRLDKNTAGLLVVAKDVTTQGLLSSMLERHDIKRTYLGIVEGIMPPHGTIDKKIMRDPNHRTLFTVAPSFPANKGRKAITHFVTIKTSHTTATKCGYSLVKFNLETGRTHQIRVHCKSIGHPLVGDPEYNPKSKFAELGQMLESVAIAFTHPRTNEPLAFEIKPTELFESVIKKLFQN